MKHTNAILSMGLLLSISVCTTENPSEWYCDICEDEMHHSTEKFEGDDLIATSRTKIERDLSVICAPGAGCMLLTEFSSEKRDGDSGSLNDGWTGSEIEVSITTESCPRCLEED